MQLAELTVVAVVVLTQAAEQALMVLMRLVVAVAQVGAGVLLVKQLVTADLELLSSVIQSLPLHRVWLYQ
jgi:hypothetical protein